MQVAFTGKRGALFWLALKTGFFTILTLGFYRFWMKTRLRRWYWSAIRPGGHPLEYVGDPLEKLLGFFIAVVVLTFYIGIVNLLLMFVSFSVFNSSWLGYIASFAGVIPIWFYARYRARRYVLGRTRWRGVRFGLERGAWGYAGRALMHWTITLLTLGLLWPRMTFALEKYRTDRTYFGSARLVQQGRWQMLYRAAIPLAVAVVASVSFAVWVGLIQPLVPPALSRIDDMPGEFVFAVRYGYWPPSWQNPERLWAVPVLMSGLLYGAIHYRWVAKRIMANHKAAYGVTFASRLQGPRIAMIYTLGIFISYMVLLLGVSLIVMLGLALYGPQEWALRMGGFGDLPRWLSLGIIGVLYLSVFLLWGVLHNTFVTFPIMRHMARTTSLPTTGGLHAISQRDRDAFAEAEGFAEALDLGAAI
ncbi:hypothetical protein BOO69_01835 [Sulfitobacter alexandrii]|uniref:DUF898 family protein n=1 Tax=Sulfitobacter alexandrii TaxID=1917485 RepID=A0A1J0WLP4_9RHOB|nr:hypothetical protein BOO69_01835 [Sulfitobacter alexandrii]